MPGTPSLIRIRGMQRTYVTPSETIRVLQDVDLDVGPGEMIAIMGPSGCGKSTLLFIMGLLLAPSGGTYEVQGIDVLSLDRRQQAEFRRRMVGFVFQSCNLIDNSTVYENVEFPLIYQGVEPRHRPAMVAEALNHVGLSHRIRHPSGLLSGGESQRVAIARALVNRPRIILADEPTGQLDRANGAIVMNDFSKVVAAGDTAMVVVTHDPEIAAQCHRTYRLTNGRMEPQ